MFCHSMGKWGLEGLLPLLAGCVSRGRREEVERTQKLWSGKINRLSGRQLLPFKRESSSRRRGNSPNNEEDFVYITRGSFCMYFALFWYIRRIQKIKSRRTFLHFLFNNFPCRGYTALCAAGRYWKCNNFSLKSQVWNVPTECI